MAGGMGLMTFPASPLTDGTMLKVALKILFFMTVKAFAASYVGRATDCGAAEHDDGEPYHQVFSHGLASS